MGSCQLIRPEINQAVIDRAAEKTAASTANLNATERGNLAGALKTVYRPYMNGYEIAKKLERYHDWEDIDVMFVEDVDAMGSYVDQIHREVCWAWVNSNNIKPPFEIGTKIKEGEITGISEYSPACFEVKLYGHDDSRDGFSRRIIKFEDAEIA